MSPMNKLIKRKAYIGLEEVDEGEKKDLGFDYKWNEKKKGNEIKDFKHRPTKSNE